MSIVHCDPSSDGFFQEDNALCQKRLFQIRGKISKICFQQLVQSMRFRIKVVMKVKGDLTQYQQGVPEVKWPVSVYEWLSNSSFFNGSRETASGMLKKKGENMV